MTKLIACLTQQEQLNFLLTNRIPRRWLTMWVGRFSRIESPRLTRLSIWLWRLFADDLDLSEAREQSFSSLHDCFIRQLKTGARPVDIRPSIVISPCDAIVGAHGRIEGTTVYQAKGFPYELGDLMPDQALQEKYRDGVFVTLRLKSSMYHRFHAPVDCRVHEIQYISGDTWNVNPIALKRIEKLYCKNERAVLPLDINDSGDSERSITLVSVAAILVASMKFHCLGGDLDLRSRGCNRLTCQASYAKGDEMGYFQHGSTIIVFATSHYSLCNGIREGAQIRMGEPLLRMQRG
jgi:phosphatidylserine decarboxylase